MRKRIKTKPLPTPTKSKNLPATMGALMAVRSELKSDITGVRLEVKSLEKRMDARFNKVDARFNKLDARFNEIDSRFSKIDSRFNQVDSRFNSIDANFKELKIQFEEVKAANFRMLALMEEQNARNRACMDGYLAVYQGQQQLEKRVDLLEKDRDAIIKLSKR